MGLVDKARDGDGKAFGLLVTAYAGPLFNMALRLSGNRAEAEDMVQESFLRAYDGLRHYDRARPFYSWLYAICLNVVRDVLRRRKHVPAQLDATTLAAFPDEALLPEQSLQQSQGREALLRALPELPLPLREAVVLRYFQELSFAELAAVCEITENAAKKRVYQGLKRLHALLDGDASFLSSGGK